MSTSPPPDPDPPTAMHTDGTDAFEVLPGRPDTGLIVVCDHACNALPAAYATLGLPAKQMTRHIAFDIGAAAVTRHLHQTLGVAAILTRYSRLLIDPNRGEDDPTLIMRLSDGAIVPGNRHLDNTERQHRIERYYRPYHTAISQAIDRAVDSGHPPALLAIHSFTESWKGVARPWAASILWEKDARLARPLLEGLRAEPGLIIGENEPYPGQYEGDTLWRHGACRGLAHAIIEIRQDLIRDAAGQAQWGERLTRIISGLMTRPDLLTQFRIPRKPSFSPSVSGTTRARAAIQQTAAAERSSAARPDTGSGGHHISTNTTATAAYAPSGNPNQESDMREIDAATQTELEAAAFRKLVEHLRQRNDVQNIDLMNLAGFCRNCLSNWYQEAASENDETLTKDEAREIVYGMAYKDWQAKYQREATKEQLAAMQKNKPAGH